MPYDTASVTIDYSGPANRPVSGGGPAKGSVVTGKVSGSGHSSVRFGAESNRGLFRAGLWCLMSASRHVGAGHDDSSPVVRDDLFEY